MPFEYPAPIVVLIDKDAEVSTDKFRWKYSIQKTDEHGMFLQVECTPKHNSTYWECELATSVKTSTNKCETVTENAMTKIPIFSNYSTVEKLMMLEDDVNGVVLYANENMVKFYDFTKSDLFDEPVEHISDIRLIADGQDVYACKKILATYSSYFQNLFYGDERNDKIKKFEMAGVPCNSFRVFLGLLYGQKNFLTVENVQMITHISSHFKAEHCLIECEQFLIHSNISSVAKLAIAQAHNFKVLQYEVLSNCHTYYDVMELNDRANHIFLTPETKLAMMERMIQLRNNEPMTPVTFQERNTVVTDAKTELNDIVLSVGDKMFYVSKQLLAYHSSYFYTMFYSNFTEKGKDQIKLKNIDENEFDMFLQLINHPSRLVTKDNFNGVLKLSDMYNVQSLHQKCEAYLKFEKNMSEVEKIKLAVKHDFQLLFEHITSKIKNYYDFQKLSEQDGFHDLDTSIIGKIALNLVKNK